MMYVFGCIYLRRGLCAEICRQAHGSLRRWVWRYTVEHFEKSDMLEREDGINKGDGGPITMDEVKLKPESWCQL